MLWTEKQRRVQAQASASGKHRGLGLSQIKARRPPGIHWPTGAEKKEGGAHHRAGRAMLPPVVPGVDTGTHCRRAYSPVQSSSLPPYSYSQERVHGRTRHVHGPVAISHKQRAPRLHHTKTCTHGSPTHLRSPQGHIHIGKQAQMLIYSCMTHVGMCTYTQPYVLHACNMDDTQIPVF